MVAARALPVLVALAATLLAAAVARAEIPLSAPLGADRAVAVVVCLDTSEYGTGWWVDESHIVTAAHVVNWGNCRNVIVMRGSWRSEAVILTATDRSSGDVAVLEVAHPLPGHPVLPLCADEPEPPFTVYIIGYPSELLQLTGTLQRLSELPRIHTATVSWYDPVRRIYEIGRTDTGNSGGPVVTPNGCVVAIVSFALRGGATELFFGSSVYWVKLALRQAGVRWQEMQAAVIDIGEIQNQVASIKAGVSEALGKATSSAATPSLEERVERLYDFLYSLYIRDPAFFAIVAVLPILGLAALASLARR